MGKDPAFPFYASDWLGSNRRAMMSLTQQGAYLLLLCRQWSDPTCSLPDDDGALAGLSELGEGWLTIGCPLVRDCFPKHPDLEGRLANLKMLELRAERDKWAAKSSKGGKKSAAKRRAKSKPVKGFGKVKGGGTKHPTNSQPNGNTPSPSPSPNNPLPKGKGNPPKSPKGELPSFAEFWQAVARHKRKNRKDAVRRYTEVVGSLEGRFEDPAAWLLERAGAYYSSDVGKTQYALGPAPWLHQGGYDDDPESWKRKDESDGKQNQPRAQAYDPDRPIGDL